MFAESHVVFVRRPSEFRRAEPWLGKFAVPVEVRDQMARRKREELELGAEAKET